MVHHLAEARLHAEQEHRSRPPERERDPGRQTGGRGEQEHDRRDLDRDGDHRIGHGIEELHEGARAEQRLGLTREVGEEGAGDPRRHHEAESDPQRRQAARVARGEQPSVEPPDHAATPRQVDTIVRRGSDRGPSSSRGISG